MPTPRCRHSFICIIYTPTHVNREIASTKHMISLMPPLNLNYPPFLLPTTPYRCSDYCTYSPYLSIVCHVSICNCICKFCSMSIVWPEREINLLDVNCLARARNKVFVFLSVSCLQFLASNTYTFRDIAFAMSKISKKGNNSKIILKMFSKISPNTSLSADTSFKFLSLILFEIWRLQNFISIFSKGRNFTRGDNSPQKMCLLFFHEESIHEFQDDISLRNIVVAKFQGPKF